MAEDTYRQQTAQLMPEVVRPLALPLARFLWGWTKRMLPWLAVFSLAFVAYDYFISWRDRPVSFLLGPPGGEAANQGEKLQNEFKKWTFLGPNYSITPIHTEGFQENSTRISGDLDGKVVGFGMDGLKAGGGDGVRTILPLDWYYLHLMIRNESLEKKLGVKPPTAVGHGLAQPILFSDLVAKLREKKPQLYLGPRSSGTRSVVNVVLDSANISSDEVEAVGIADFQEMVAALRQGKIDGAFFITALGSNTVGRATKEADCTLISFDTAAQLANSAAYLEKCEIPASTYSYPPPRGALDKVDSLAVRRVLLAPVSMSATDANEIARHVQATFPSSVSKPLSEDYKYPGPGPRTTENEKRLKFDVHPGALLGTTSISPPTWFDRNAYWLAPLLFAMIVSFFGAWKADIAKWLENHSSQNGAATDQSADETAEATADESEDKAGRQKRAPAAAVASERANIEAQVSTILNDMHHAADLLLPDGELPSRASVDHWSAEINQVYQRIFSARRDGRLSVSDSLELKHRAFELQRELEFLKKPPWYAAKPKPRGKSKAPRDNEQRGNGSAASEQ